MSILPNCPGCNSEYAYQDGSLFVCPECAHEWAGDTHGDMLDHETIMDSNGNILGEGDSVIVTKDLKVKGSSSSIKKGTKIKNIRLIYNSSDGHDIDCKIDGFGAMKLKSEFVKKA